MGKPIAEASKLLPRELKKEGYNSRYEKVRKALLQQFPLCQWCHNDFSDCCHHIDHNSSNHYFENLVVLCTRCHKDHHRGHNVT